MTGEHNFHIDNWKFYQQDNKEGKKSWILLDSGYTTDIFGESKYLTSIKTVPTTLNIMTNVFSLPTN